MVYQLKQGAEAQGDLSEDELQYLNESAKRVMVEHHYKPIIHTSVWGCPKCSGALVKDREVVGKDFEVIIKCLNCG